MSESLAVGHAQTRPAGRAGDTAGIAALDARRKLQLALGVIWVLDGILQFQPSMFTKSFPDMLAESAHGNPGVVAGPITWSASLIAHHVVVRHPPHQDHVPGGGGRRHAGRRGAVRPAPVPCAAQGGPPFQPRPV